MVVCFCTSIVDFFPVIVIISSNFFHRGIAHHLLSVCKRFSIKLLWAVFKGFCWFFYDVKGILKCFNVMIFVINKSLIFFEASVFLSEKFSHLFVQPSVIFSSYCYFFVRDTFILILYHFLTDPV